MRTASSKGPSTVLLKPLGVSSRTQDVTEPMILPSEAIYGSVLLQQVISLRLQRIPGNTRLHYLCTTEIASVYLAQHTQ